MGKDELRDGSFERRALLSIKRLQLELEQIKKARTEPIAVIGIGCRFPGDASSPEAFWSLLADGRDTIQEMPADRYDVDAFYHPDVEMPGKMVSRWGSFLDHIDQFDAAFFGISPREAMFMDPQQRILLEVAWEALERAGLPAEKLAESSTGVFMGLFNQDYMNSFLEQLLMDHGTSSNAYIGTGTGSSFAAGRLSYLLGLQGPSMVVDTVCSSSLVAVHLACQSLRDEECLVALAGAANLNFYPTSTLITSKMRALSPRGRCRTFDASADGFVRGEGSAVLVLKRLSQAQADGDTIHALIRGSAVNHDGRSNGLTAPSGKAQQAVLRRALQNAGVKPEQISYIEAHGTGTILGDPIEFEALKAVIGQAHPEGSVCMLGSVKTNIGHLEAAAGMAGLVKTILCMQHQAIPPHLHLETLNPHIHLEHTPFVIPKRLSVWSTSGGPRYAGVSAAGLSGTNAHIILEEAPGCIMTEMQQQNAGEAWLLPLSAKEVPGLRELAQSWYRELREPGMLSHVSLRHICSTASLRRTHYPQRLALVGTNKEELTEQLEAFLQEELAPGMSSGIAGATNARPVFIFSGQGAQWVGMGQKLFKQEAVFRSALEKCDALLQKHVSWSLLTELQADEVQSRLQETAIAQPALFSVQVALSDLWRSWGIEPAAVVGHSIGEITAAYVAGILDLEDAIRIVARRGMLMQQAHGLGYMAAVAISETQAREFLVDYAGRVALAAVNSPTSVVLSGETTALHEVLEKMQKSNILPHKLNVEYAFHSPQMEVLRTPLIEGLQGITPRAGKLLLLSTVTGEPGSGEEYDAAYWGRNMCQTVYFGPAIEKLQDMGYTSFLEISPQPVLTRSVKQCLAHHKQSGLVLSSLRQGIDERTTMLTTLGTLYVHGYPISWEHLYPASKGPYKVAQLPTYPWQRKHYWFSEKKFSMQYATASSSHVTGHPLLARRVRSATQDSIFETLIHTETFPWLADHRVFGVTVFPASAYIEMMRKSVRMALPAGEVCLTNLFIHQALVVSPDQKRVVQIVLQSSPAASAGEIQILSCLENADTDVWTLHASSHYQSYQSPASISTQAEHTDLDSIRQRCTELTQAREYYQRMQTIGLVYGPAFQGLQQIWSCQGEALGQLRFPEQLLSEQSNYFMHPAFLDACLHTAASVVGGEPDDLYLPLSIDTVSFYQQPGRDIWVHVQVKTRNVEQGLVIACVHILGELGELIALIDGFHLWRTSRTALAAQAKTALPHWLYTLQWDQKARRDTSLEGNHLSASWLLFCENNGTGSQLAQQLRAQGEQCFLIFADQCYQVHGPEHYTLDPSCPEHFHMLLQACSPLLKNTRCRIVYLWALDTIVATEANTDQLMQEVQRLCGGLLHLVQAAMGRSWVTSPQLWVMTQNSQDVPGTQVASASTVVQAPLWGLGRVIAYEQPDLHCRLVDFPDQSMWDRTKFIEELLNPELEDQIALRREGRYVARLAVAASDAAYLRKQQQNRPPFQNHETLQLSTTGTYLITGGLGGLGIAIGQWMVEQCGVRYLVLIGRHAPPAEILPILRQLELHGAQILVAQADVADREQMAALLKTIQQTMPPLRGIIHAAGVLDDGVLVQQKWARFAHVLAPKMLGSWNLHVLTQDIALDFFALFSSAAALVAAPGQANYAAANAFMDGLAHYRRSQGLPAVSINWGAWADMGMTRDAVRVERRLEREGMQPIRLEQGLAVLEQVLLDDPIQVAVLPIDWSIYSEQQREERVAPLFSNVAGKYNHQPKQAVSAERAEKSEAFKLQLDAVSVSERLPILLEYVSHQVIAVLGLDPTSHFEHRWNLFERGLDSLMAIELRNALHKGTGLTPPANLVFDYPTIEALATYLAAHLPPAHE